MDKELSREIDRIKSQGLYRTFRRTESTPGPWTIMEERPLLNLGSNNYLGLAEHPAVCEAAVQAIAKWGAGATGSRLTSGNLALHESLEDDIARFKSCEASLVFGSGYAAGVGAIPALVENGDLILSDSLNHASLIDGCRLSRAEIRIFRHKDVEHARALLDDRAQFRRCLLVTDGVFSMDGDLAPLPELSLLCSEFDIWLLVDDAHGTGVLGASGRGIMEHFGLSHENTIQMGTLSKALGSEGGFVAGSASLIDYLRNRARSFIYSTAPAPAAMAAAKAALGIVIGEPQRRQILRQNGEYFSAALAALGVTVPNDLTPIIPVVLGSAEKAMAFSDALEAAGVWAPAIRPPTVPAGKARLRICLMSTHTKEDLDLAIQAIGAAL